MQPTYSFTGRAYFICKKLNRDIPSLLFRNCSKSQKHSHREPTAYNNAPDRTRTCNLRIRSPLQDKSKNTTTICEQKTYNSRIDISANHFAPNLPLDPDLVSVIEKWPTLPVHIRAAISSLIQIPKPDCSQQSGGDSTPTFSTKQEITPERTY